MRASCVTLLLLLAVSVARSQETGAEAAARDLIAACVDVASDDDIGLAALEVPCPGIEHALTESGYIGFISESETESLSIRDLIDLQEIALRYQQPPASPVAELDVAKLRPILDTLQEEHRAERPLTWFERFKRWLNGLSRRDQKDEEESWLSRWLREVDVPARVTQGIVLGAIVLIILLAIVIVVNELRTAGVFRRRGRRSGKGAAADDNSLTLAHATLADLQRVAPVDRPTLLLRVLVNTLVNTGRLRAAKSLTHSELGARAVFDAADQRQCFDSVASLSERILYGGRQVAADEIDAVVESGRALDVQLASPRATP